MSNSKSKRGVNYRWKLLSSVSALTLLGSVYSVGLAEAAQNDSRPPVWLEMGWQFEGVSGSPVPFMPPFTDTFAAVGAEPADIAQKVMAYSYGAESKISFRPEGSDWIFSGAVRYGRAHAHKKTHVQTNNPPQTFHTTGAFGRYPASNPLLVFQGAYKSARSVASNADKHLIVDFQTGRDVGLGMLGDSSTSVVNVGVRFAKINARSSADLAALPDFEFKRHRYRFFFHATYFYNPAWHNYAGSSQNDVRFSGIGPSVSWTGSLPMAGNLQDGEMTVDWGANAALLFGRQQTKGQHQAAGHYKGPSHFDGINLYGPSPVPHERSRRVAVPDIGGFAGLSLQWSDAKLSLGYRADFFFNALDTGIDARHETTRGYYGPFASISIGLGGSDN